MGNHPHIVFGEPGEENSFNVTVLDVGFDLKPKLVLSNGIWAEQEFEHFEGLFVGLGLNTLLVYFVFG